MKKIGKTARPFRYDPYDYTVEVRNRFKGLGLIERVPDELWTEVHDVVQETWIKTIPKKNVASEMTQRQDTHTRNRQRHNSGRRRKNCANRLAVYFYKAPWAEFHCMTKPFQYCTGA